ncbi:MAG: SLC45 family MFS transporter [Leptolyngbyaceae cyanobacterium RM1_1_2]|nr:SLC45 family MFS transporter [Leptolyngbyaceae cyanobacterium RM1_1_2]
MSFGIFGIQFGWGLQMANTSAIFEHLGAEAKQIPILWLAAPLTGLFVQPIIGNLSDNTWGVLGRRRPYFLVGAILSSLALLAMPNASNLWVAVGLLWILDTSANISMEPFRAFVGDLLPPEQRTKGFAMQSLLVGLSSILAASLPWLLTHVLGVSAIAPKHAVPPAIKLSFYIGAAVFLGTVLWTVFTTEEYPPPDMDVFKAQQERRLGFSATFREISTALKQMPPIMRQLAWVQGFSWLGMYCLFLYFPPAIAHNILGAVDEASPLYAEGIEWAGLCIAMYSAVCFAFSLVLPKIAAATSRKTTHALCLACGAAGLISLSFVPNQYWVLLSMVGVGIAWASILAMPYAMLVGVLPPKKSGIYLGIFNFFIVLPQILASLGLGWLMVHVLQGDRLTAVILGGVFMLIAALLTQRVQEASKLQPDSLLTSDAAGSNQSAAEVAKARAIVEIR